jgi:transcriptional regulator with XRE-family HTH domain
MVDSTKDVVDEKKIVENIKKTRLEREMSLDHLAKLAGLTKGYLSKIENARKPPPLSTLLKIAAALDVDVTELISGPSGSKENVRISIVRAGERQMIATKAKLYGYDYQELAHKKMGKSMEPYILQPSFSKEAVFSHEGEEFMYVLEGTHEFLYGEERYVLEAGDAIYFDSEVPHSGRSIGPKRARVLAIIWSRKTRPNPDRSTEVV